MKYFFLNTFNFIINYLLALVFIIALFTVDIIFNLEILTTTLYAMDSSQEALLKLNETIDYWQGDVNNLNEFKQELIKKFQTGLLTCKEYNHEMNDIQEQIIQSNNNVSESIKEKGELLKKLNMPLTTSSLGKRS